MCPSASSPVAFINFVLVQPSSLARAFIWATKPSSLPATASPSATVASFAEAITAAFKRSSTVMVSPGSSHICEPPILLACSLAVITSSTDNSPRSIASIIRSSDIIFVIDAGGSFSSAFISYKIFPVFTSNKIADFAFMSSFVPIAASVTVESIGIFMSDISHSLETAACKDKFNEHAIATHIIITKIFFINIPPR